MKTKRNILNLLLWALLVPFPLFAQDNSCSISGIIVDEQNGETLPFAQIYFIKSTSDKGSISSGIGTTSDMDGAFSIGNHQGYTTLCIQMMGYKTELVTLKKGQHRKDVTIKLTPDVYGLQDIVVTPKHRKREYRRKGNPAVELIKEVIAHRDSASVRTEPFYTAETYNRMSFSVDNFNIDFTKPFWKNFSFVEKYIDTTGVYPSLVVSIRENQNLEYYQRKPHREKRILQKKRIFGVEDLVGSGTFQENVNAIFKDFDINEDNINILFNRFVSPLSKSLAVSFYQYYIMDTVLVDGYPCIDLAFVPVNSESFGFTGHLYIVNDSTFKLKRYSLNIPPDINLNFVSNYSVEHTYCQRENGLWAPERTNIYAKFYILNNQKGMLARQTKIYTGWDFDTPIDKEVFSAFTADEVEQTNDSTAVRLDADAWEQIRPEPLTKYETSVYDLVGEFTANPMVATLIGIGNALTSEFIATAPAKTIYDSKFDIGPIYNTYSWNTLEGSRIRFGGASTAKMHEQMFFRGYAAYGFADKRPKGSLTLVYTFDKHKSQPYDGLRHHIQVMGQYDVEEPGQATDIIRRDHILMSIPTGKPTLGFNQYVAHAQVEYMKEWQNKLSLKAVFDYTNCEAAGALTYNRVEAFDASGNIALQRMMPAYNCYEGRFTLRYSPGSRLYIDRMGCASPFAMENDAPLVELTHTIGFLDDRMGGGDGFVFNRTEVMFDKRFWFSAFGHLDLRLQTGMIWNRVPFTKLYIPQTSTSIFLAQRSFNQMKPMEFLSDAYVALFATYYFKGWILNRIPGINRLKLRGVVSFAGMYGGLTDKNNPYLPQKGTGLYAFPNNATYDQDGYVAAGCTSSPIGKLPYMELTAGFENIFKFIRIDYIRRLTYNDYLLPDGIHRRKMGAWGRNGVKVTVRFAL